ncbi:asparagine synthase (glutamine-hydrolyzing) [Candidatus Parcubacteria bacterium]|nr:MAG: asparagine synthase (glutamine-hydrolyzing) [Candidatus Parcubacteria bacterium]
MCGIIGQYGKQIDTDAFVFKRDLLKHRGPDSSGLFVSADEKLALGHRRLSIIDLSDRAKQPMKVGDYVIIYNGEVYNFNELRKDLASEYLSSSDTEVILRAYIKYGTSAFAKFDGMFALAIYDQNKNELILARDRYGIKPLYYSTDDNNFFFASELKCFAQKKINHKSLAKYFYQYYVYGEDTILEGVNKLEPGTFAIYDLTKKTLRIEKYWQPTFAKKYQGQLEKAKKDLHDVLSASVKQSLISDVPLGVFLSSGIDSSLITAITKERVDKVDTFTIGFDFSSFDESQQAGETAKMLGTNHHRIILDKNEVLKEIPNILDAFDEPFGDSSAIPTYFLNKFAKEKVTVCLSGDGADELFGGYPIYYLPQANNLYRKLPAKKLIEKIVFALPSSAGKMSLDYKLKRFVYAAKYPFTKAHFYYRIMHNQGLLKPEFLAKAKDDFSEYFAGVKDENILNQLLYVDQKTVMEGDYLVKVDRMSMKNSLEVRVPFLNNQVIDFANSLDPKLKIYKNHTKYILKKLLEDYLPKEFIYRKKQGFSFPIAQWLRYELKDFMLDTLSADNIDSLEFLNKNKAQEMIQDHLSSKRDYNRELWALISLVRYIKNNKIGV